MDKYIKALECIKNSAIKCIADRTDERSKRNGKDQFRHALMGVNAVAAMDDEVRAAEYVKIVTLSGDIEKAIEEL